MSGEQASGPGITKKGPERFIGQPLRFLGMDAYSAIGFIPAVIFPFNKTSWILVFVILVLIFIASRFRLPSYQLLRYLRVRCSPKLIPPVPEQLDREKRSARRWPF